MKKVIKKTLRKLGFELKRLPGNDLVRRMKIVNSWEIDVLFDIGANVGQYAKIMRELGYKNMIVSFEPMKKAFEELKIKSSKDSNWLANNYGLGSQNSKSIINVALNSKSSSILNMLPE